MSVCGIAERIDGKIYREWQEENGVAVWQFQCNIIPLRENIDKLDCDEIISWQGVSQPKINLYFLEREKGWSTDIVQYGKTEETYIEFLFAKNELEEISYRLDLRTLTKYELTQIIEYVQSIEAYFLLKIEFIHRN